MTMTLRPIDVTTHTTSSGSASPKPMDNEASGPDLRRLLDRFHFDVTEGCIWLDDRRVLVLQSDWFAQLRSELIELMGIEKARGLLTRLGYSAGCRDGQLALRVHSDRPIMEVLLSGGQLHALQGTVCVIPLFVDLNLAARHCHLEFAWKNSMEDQAHISAMPSIHEAACWMEVGYASGFLSTIFGGSVIVREIECKALGYSMCRCVARFEHEWDDASEDLKYLQAWQGPSLTVQPDKDSPSAAAGAVSGVNDESATVGRSAAFNAVLHKLERVARTDATVLLLGESGVGKSLLARELHRRSHRADGPFVELNCGSLPEALLESELFGVERGAYTGAHASRAGRFEMAANGTLFLDEIGTLGYAAQGKLLRVLQTGEFERLGGAKTLRGNVRLVAATNEDLRRLIKEGKFRLDLYYRLNIFPIEVPPLRERRDDLPLLIERFIARFRARHGKSGPVRITPRAYRALLSHTWPGNVRELENVLERATILMSDDEPLDLHHLFLDPGEIPDDTTLMIDNAGHLVSSRVAEPSPTSAASSKERAAARETRASTSTTWTQQALEQADADGLVGLERQLVLAALAAADGNTAIAARKLGLTRAQIDYRLKKWGVRV